MDEAVQSRRVSSLVAGADTIAPASSEESVAKASEAQGAAMSEVMRRVTRAQ